MEISYDPAKREETLRERGPDFADAGRVFEGETFTQPDVRFAYGEERHVTYGRSTVERLWWCGPSATGSGGSSLCGTRTRRRSSMSDWVDPDDAPELTEAFFRHAEIAVGGKVIRPATGYLGPNGVVRGRPPARGVAKRQVTLRLDPDVVERFRADGPGWQGRINAALRKAVGL